MVRLDVEYGIKISLGRVARLMKQMDLPKMSTAKSYKKKNLDNTVRDNVIKQNFSTSLPNCVWVSDITYLKVGGRHAYLCVIIDLFSRMVVGWKLSNSMKANLVCDTLNASFVKRGRPTNLIFHSDQGSQYTSSEFKNLLDYFNITAYFSKKGYPYDNAVCESFFKFLKKECTNKRSYASFDDLKEDLFDTTFLRKWFMVLHFAIFIFFSKSAFSSSVKFIFSLTFLILFVMSVTSFQKN